MRSLLLCALLFWALRISRDSRPEYLYAGWLLEGDESRRVHAAQELAGANEAQSLVAASLIRAIVSDPAVAVRKQSVRSLALIVSKQSDGQASLAAATALVQALKDKDATVRTAAADALGAIAADPELAAPALLRAASDGDEWVRGAAIMALGLIQRKAWEDRHEVRDAILAAMNDPSLHVRELGLYAYWATAEISPGLSRAFLMDDDVRKRRAAAHALARSGRLAKRVRLELTASLTDPDTAVRDDARRALENAGLATTSQ